MVKNADAHVRNSNNRLSLEELPVGAEVLCQKEWDRSGLIIEVC